MQNVLPYVFRKDPANSEHVVAEENDLPSILSIANCVVGSSDNKFDLISPCGIINALKPINPPAIIIAEAIRVGILFILPRARENITTEIAFRANQWVRKEVLLEAPVDSLLCSTGVAQHFIYPSQ